MKMPSASAAWISSSPRAQGTRVSSIGTAAWADAARSSSITKPGSGERISVPTP